MGFSSKQVSGDIHYLLQVSSVKGGLEIPKPERQEEKKKTPLLKCPRCESTNTKFCYYNNYNRSQPRHFCRVCRRHWTEGGTLRNVPIGGCRKNKRRKITPTSTSSTEILRQVPPQLESPNDGTTDGFFGASLPYNTSLTYLEDFSGGSSGFVWSGGSIPFTPAAMEASTGSTWVKGEPVLPASYWDFWDGAVDFSEAYVGQPAIPQL